jgi:hypothetical protein
VRVKKSTPHSPARGERISDVKINRRSQSS